MRINLVDRKIMPTVRSFCLSLFSLLFVVVGYLEFWNFSYAFYGAGMLGHIRSAVIHSESEGLACRYPQLDPRHPSIAAYIHHPRYVNCSHKQPDLSYVDYDGFLHLNVTELQQWTSSNRGFHVNCTYQHCQSPFMGIGDAVVYSNESALEPDSPVALQGECVAVRCVSTQERKKGSRALYFNVHAHPANASFPAPRSRREGELSIFMFLIDSLSHSAAQRNLPKTLAYLSQYMNMKVFEGFAKVGLNTFPNLIPVFTGKRARTPQRDMPDEFNMTAGAYGRIHFDDWNFIWKLFASKGYVTSFLDDLPHIGIFHYNRKGFKVKPFHHYYDPVFSAIKRSPKKQKYCFANRPTMPFFLDIITRQLIKYEYSPQFMIAMHTELSHDQDNDIEMADDDLTRFFANNFERGLFNNTAIIFFSDHGIRFGNIRRTTIGRFEESMPFFSIFLPPSFYEKHPLIEQYLNVNLRRLSTHFDTYETLMDILYKNFDGQQRSSLSRGLSHFYPIPANRTCQSAGIPAIYCPCMELINPLNPELIQQAAEHLVGTLNAKLAANRLEDLCAPLVLKQITSANALTTSLSSDVNNENLTLIHIGVQVEPSSAMFEGLVQYRPHEIERHFTLFGEADRTNAYGNQSFCVHDEYVKILCFCRTFLH